MPKVAKGKRQRAYRPKTTSGCLTCKARRIKCDEARPACLRCTSTRRTCDGYSSSTPTFSPPNSSSPKHPLLVDRVDRSPSLEIHACDRSATSFSFFIHYTSPQLAGFFGSPFWERLVLQTARHEPAIHHAVVAIGSLHLQQQRRQTPDTLNSVDAEKMFALEQYNLAIRSLLAPSSPSEMEGERTHSVPVDVCLILSILLTCFENMHGRHEVAGRHIRGGAKLLLETVYDPENGRLQHDVLESQDQQNTYVPLEVLATFFAGLDGRVATIIQDYKFKKYKHHFFADILERDCNPPPIFTSIDEAKDVFEYGFYLFGQQNNSSSERILVPDADQHLLGAMQGRYTLMATLLSTFSNAMEELIISKGPSLTAREQVAILVLQLHCLYAYVSSHIERSHSLHLLSGINEVLLPHMREMVKTGEKIVSILSSSGDGTKTSFYMGHLGYIIPLYTVASQCHDAGLRRKAIALLLAVSRQEGLWNSILVAKACERIMEIEEREGTRLMGFAETHNSDPSSNGRGPEQLFSEPFPTVLRLDNRGGRLHYMLQNKDGTPSFTRVVEKVFDW